MKKPCLALFFCVFFTLAVGLAAGALSHPDAWYHALNKPSWIPPDWLFTPVWILLYLMMGISAWFVWERRDVRLSYMALTLYLVQLVLNASWALIFFGLKNPGLAFIEICLLWFSIMATIVFFWRIYRPSGLLLLPYFLWVTFAVMLNFSIWQLNKIIA